MARKVEQQEVIKQNGKFYIATTEVEIARKEVISRKILQVDNGPFDTHQEAELHWEEELHL